MAASYSIRQYSPIESTTVLADSKSSITIHVNAVVTFLTISFDDIQCALLVASLYLNPFGEK